MRPIRRLEAIIAALALTCIVGGCKATPSRHDMLLLNEELRGGNVTNESVDAVLATIQALAADPPTGDEALYTATSLARVALESPMGLARAEALRAAWVCLEPFEKPAWDPDQIELTMFVERTRRIEELMLTVDEPTAAERAELTELVTWLSELRIGPDKVRLSVDIADVVTSRTVDEFTGGVALDEEGTVIHAVTLVTVHLAGDPFPAVRQEVGASLRHLHPSIGAELLTLLAIHETDALALIRALDALAPRLAEYPSETIETTLAAFTSHPDPSVARRAVALSAAR